MAVELHRPDDHPDNDVLDVEEVGRLTQYRARLGRAAARRRAHAKEAFAEQKARVAQRLSLWFSTSDIPDEQLARDIEQRRRQAQNQQTAELEAHITGLKAKLAVAEDAARTGLALQLSAAETQLKLRRENTPAIVIQP